MDPINFDLSVPESQEESGSECIIYKLLGIDPNSDSGTYQIAGISQGQVVLKFTPSHVPCQGPLKSPQIEVIRSLICNKHVKDIPDGAVVVIKGPQGFLLQRKDYGHPKKNCRHRLCLVGGRLKAGEDLWTGAFRELFEEVNNLAIALEIAALMRYQDMQKLPGVQWPGTYNCHWFVANAATDRQFERWMESIYHRCELSESDPVFVSTNDMSSLIQAEENNPGSQFVGSQNKLIELAIQR